MVFWFSGFPNGSQGTTRPFLQKSILLYLFFLPANTRRICGRSFRRIAQRLAAKRRFCVAQRSKNEPQAEHRSVSEERSALAARCAMRRFSQTGTDARLRLFPFSSVLCIIPLYFPQSYFFFCIIDFNA